MEINISLTWLTINCKDNTIYNIYLLQHIFMNINKNVNEIKKIFILLLFKWFYDTDHK